MDEIAPSPESPARPLAALVVERWAAFAKALSIYPPTNSRVVDTLGELTGLIDRIHKERGGPFAVEFARGRYRVGGEEHELVPGTNPAWLDERVQGCALAGVEVREGVDRAPLIAFTRRLLDNWAGVRRDRSFADLWPSTYAGLRLLPRRFDGGFGDGDAERAALPADMDPEEYRRLVELLLDDDGVLERLDHLRAGVRAGDDVQSVDVIGKIVGMIPVDRIGDAGSVLALTRQALDALAVGGEVSGGERVDDDEGMSRFLVVASQKLFARDASGALVAAEESASPRARGHARDDEITEDVDAFRSEFDALPRASLASLPGMESAPEQLGVYLHYLVHLESDDQARRLHAPLRGFLDERRPEELAVLKQYLELLRPGRESRAELRGQRLTEVLARLDLSWLLRELGIVTADQTVASFPAGFCTYFDALDLANVCDRDELNSVCARIGPERFRAGAKELVAEGLLENGRPKRLLDVPVPSLMPVASVILEKGAALRPLVVDFLRKLKLDAKEACLLRIAEEAEYFPREYLLGILNPGRGGRAAAAKLRQWVSLMLCRYLRDHRDSPRAEARCIYALKHLPDFWSEEAERLVVELARRPGGRFFSRKPATPLNAAAQETARIYGLH